MKNALLSLIMLSALTFFSSCGNENESSGTVSTENGAETGADTYVDIPFEKDAIYLERFYATSTGDHPAEALLDGNPDTYWNTMPGAGVNEGVMIYFPSPTEMGQIEVLGAKGADLEAIELLEVYVNGALAGTMKPGNFVDVKSFSPVSAVFIRIAETKSEGVKTYFDYRKEENIYLTSSTSSQPTGLSEIRFIEGENTLKIRPLRTVPGTVTASSTLAPEAAYSPSFLFDSRTEFGWAEGAEGPGLGEKLTFEFDQDVKIERLKLWNGYQRSDKHFAHNARAMSISFGADGNVPGKFKLSDEQAAQRHMMEGKGIGKKFNLTVNQIYPGEKYEDLVLSELRFHDGNRWFSMETKDAAERKAKLEAQIKGSFMENWVDRFHSDKSVYEVDVNEYHYNGEDISFLLRSDNSFVLYRTSEEKGPTDNRKIMRIADGNWEIKSLGKNRAEVRIFGKIRRVSDKVNIYKGKSTGESTNIFQENITLTPDFATGGRMFDTLHLKMQEKVLRYLDEADGIALDIRYATGNNFMEYDLYGGCAICMLRPEAAEALLAAAKDFEKQGYKIKAFDCYRPKGIQFAMWEKVPDARYVADPHNGGSIHNRGCAIDMTLLDKNGKPLDMGSDYDHFGEESHYDYAGISEEVKANRKLLRETMAKHGFAPMETEWWHFNHESSKKYDLLDGWPCMY